MKPTAMILCAGLLSAASPTHVNAQQQKAMSDDLVGSWSLVSVYNILPDGKKIYPNGEKAKGRAIFDNKGNFTVVLLSTDIPKFSSNNRQQGTPDEFKAVAQGVLAYFGKYTVDEGKKTITFNFEASSFPNMVGQPFERKVSISGDELQWVTQGAPSGGVAYNNFKRMK